MKEKQNGDRSLLFKSFREDFRRSTDKKRFHSNRNRLGNEISLPAAPKTSSKVSPFGFLADYGLENLLPHLQIRHVQAGETLWYQDEPGLFITFVDRGKIKLTKRTEFNNHQVVVGLIGKGSLIGDFCMVEDSRFSTTATAMEHSLLGLLDVEKIQEILANNPDLGIRLLTEILNSTSSQLRQSYNRLIHLF